MKPIYALSVSLLILTNIVLAQTPQLINSGELIKQGAMLYDSGKYKQALTLYNKINRSDTNYVRCLYEKAITLKADSNYEQAIKLCQEALALKEQREFEPDIYNAYGNTLDAMKQHDQAIKVFDIGIAKYPSYALLYFNKGVALMAADRNAEAEVWFQKALMITPYMYSSHYYLSLIALQQGKIVQSFMSAMGYLLMLPDGKYAGKCIGILSEISKGSDEVLKYKEKRSYTPDENYQAVEEILLSKIALDKGYKPIIELDDPISRQIQAVFEKIEYNDKDKDFWSQYYLPYYKQLFKSKKFELFINHIFSNATVPAIVSFNKHNKSQMDVFIANAGEYFNTIRATRQLMYNDRDTVSKKYVYDNGQLFGKGVFNVAGKKTTLTGYWEMYYPAGNIKARGIYNDAGEMEGEWRFYYNSGTLKTLQRYNAGKLDGLQEYYFTNGNPSSKEEYRNGLAEGKVTTYYYGGALKSIVTYLADKKDGEEKEFHNNGNVSNINNFVNGVLSGPSKAYYQSGPLKGTLEYVNNKAEGPYTYYYETGQKYIDGQYAKDNEQGEWKYYYTNGKVKEVRHYADGTESGIHEEYFDNGQLSASYTGKKHKLNGDATYYRKDGKPLAKYVYDGGRIKSVTYFDKEGKELSSAEVQNKKVDIVAFDDDGLKSAHFYLDTKGNFNGSDTVFYASGGIKQINQYKDGDLDGPALSYYLNGKKKSEIS